MTIQQIMNDNSSSDNELTNKIKYQKYILEIKDRVDSIFQDWRRNLLNSVEMLTEKKFNYPVCSYGPEANKMSCQEKMLAAAMEDKDIMKEAFKFIHKKSMRDLKFLEDAKNSILNDFDEDGVEDHEEEPKVKAVEIEVNTAAPAQLSQPVENPVTTPVNGMFGY